MLVVISMSYHRCHSIFDERRRFVECRKCIACNKSVCGQHKPPRHLQKADPKNRSHRNLLLSWKLKFPEQYCRHSAHDKVLYNTNNSRCSHVGRFINAMIVSLVLGVPGEINLFPERVKGSATDEEVYEEHNEVGGDEAYCAINGK